MIHQDEAKFQGWRALAIFTDGRECLLYVGRSTTQVRAGYIAALTEMLDEEERSHIDRIALQCWQGAADQGYWLAKSTLPIPSAFVTADAPADPQPQLLPFRRPEAVPAASFGSPRKSVGR